MMCYEIERAFGRVLGLDYSQVNPGALQAGTPGGTQGWPVMHPLSGVCGASGGECIPNPTVLRDDDIAALNRIYPITAQNLANFPGKQLTAANTISIRGTISFRTGLGMQGVNVVARPLDSNGNPLYQYTVTAVSGALFSGNHGNPVTGLTDSAGVPFTQWGSTDPPSRRLRPQRYSAPRRRHHRQLPAHIPINRPALHPHGFGRPLRRGPGRALGNPPVHLPPRSHRRRFANRQCHHRRLGHWRLSGCDRHPSLAASDARKRRVGRPSQPGRPDRLVQLSGARPPHLHGCHPGAGRNRRAHRTESHAFYRRLGRIRSHRRHRRRRSSRPQRPCHRRNLAARLLHRPTTSCASASPTCAATAAPTTPTTAGCSMPTPSSPPRLPASGGPIMIHGMGFRLADTVLVDGQPALVTSISPNEITAIAPAAASGVTGSVDVEVDDQPVFYAAAVISGGLSYDSGTGDALTLIPRPPTPCPRRAHPLHRHRAGPKSHARRRRHRHLHRHQRLRHSRLRPPRLLRHRHRRRPRHHERHRGDTTWSTVTASLTNGSSLQAQFAGGTPPVLSSLTHGHSGTVCAVQLGSDDPRVFWGPTPIRNRHEDDRPPVLFSESALEFVDSHERRLDHWQAVDEKCQRNPAEKRRLGGVEWVRRLPGMAGRLPACSRNGKADYNW